ncbi:HNH endonuclease [Promicromonospora aerolata]|uniref:HNH endonuclease n=1 Tax=Promicromonospora aerolata TaxID=195749 RepID=A0ABW4V0V3_9MICO
MRGGPTDVETGVLLDDVLPVDPFPDDRSLGAVVERDGVQVHLVLDDVTPGPGEVPDWPPDTVPVALWPVGLLQQALSGVPGAGLARVVAEVSATEADRLADLSDDALGDLVSACGRLQAWAAGVQARAVAHRAARETHPLAHGSLVGQVTSELVVTEPEATEVVVRGESGARHPTVIAALEAGRIDVRKAQTLLRSAAQLTVAERAEAIARFLPRAPRRTWRWLQARMLEFAKARHGAAETARTAAQGRCVQLDRAENDMGWLSAYLPAVDAAAVWGVVDDMAHQLRHVTGEERTLGQLRADSLTGIVTGRLLPADRYTDTSTDTSTDTDTDTSTSTDTEPGLGAGGDAHPEGLDVPGTGDADPADQPVCTCGGRAPVVEQVVQEVVQPVRVTPTRPVVRVTVPASALLGLDDAPGELRGFGPIPADVARVIATDATWQRLLTDPSTGVLTDYSTTTYRPGKVLSAAVQARDETCTFPFGCDSPAAWDDLDHIVPFDHDLDPATSPPGTPGQTRAANLQPLCRKHHLLKTHAGWGVVRDPDTGITTWTTPTGRQHERPPTVLDPHAVLEDVDPDTSGDLTLRALTGQRLPRSYATTGSPAAPGYPDPADPGAPPF